MKKLIIGFVIILTYSLVGCEKDFLVPKKELPKWLIESIKADEKEIAKGEKSTVGAGSWKRTEWNGEYFYEYFNGLNSYMSKVRTHDGGTLDVYVGVSDPNIPYTSEKCCSKCVWKGPYGLCIDE